MGWLRRLCGGWRVGGGWLDQLKIRLISAEAEALLGLSELGNILPQNRNVKEYHVWWRRTMHSSTFIKCRRDI